MAKAPPLTPEEKAARKEEFRKMCRKRQTGKKHSPETKKKIGKAARGQKHLDTSKERMSEAQRERIKKSGE